MKKAFVICLAFLIVVVLFACSSNSAVDNGAVDNPPAGGEGSVLNEKDNAASEENVTTDEVNPPAGGENIVVTPAAGWESMESAGILFHYSKDGASFMLKEEPYSSETLDEVIEEAKGIYEGFFDNVQFTGSVEDLTIDGKEAKQFFYTCDISGFSMKYQNVIFFVGHNVYVVTCGSLEDDFDSVSKDFGQMIGSIRFE